MISAFSNLFILLFILLPFLTGCSRREGINTLSFVSGYRGASYSSIDSYSIKRELSFILNMFEDTTSSQHLSNIWPYYSTPTNPMLYSATQPDMDNIATMRKILSSTGYTNLTLEPATYETLFALTRLPVALYVLSQEFESGREYEKYRNISKTSDIPRELYQSSRLELIHSVSRTENLIELKTTGHITINGNGSEKVTESITFGDSGSYIKHYVVYCITRLSQAELESYLAEWYSRLPIGFDNTPVLKPF